MATKTQKTEGSANGATKTATKRKIVAQPATARAIKPTAPVKKTAPRKKPATSQIAQEVIALRAYFIGETRMRTGQPGDSLSDWIEAERQLLAETGK